MREDEFPLRMKVLRWIGRQTWIPRGQVRLLRAVRSPDDNRHFLFDVDFFGMRYRGDLAHYIDWVVFCFGAYAHPELAALAKAATALKANGATTLSFYDIGANVGHHTLFMAPRVDQVLAFEPFDTVRKLMEQKLELNDISNVKIFPFGLGEIDHDAKYFPGSGSNSGAGSLIGTREVETDETVVVGIRNGDEVLERRALPKMDIVKIDVEGYEGAVFRGLSRRIKQDRPVILTELSDDSRKSLGSEENFRRLLYDGAVVAEVTGKYHHKYELKPFDYDHSREALIVPPELRPLLDS